jgi:hypothetical protein
MVRTDLARSLEREALIRWTAHIGAVTAEAVAIAENVPVASAGGRLRAAERAGLLTCSRPLAKRPGLYTVTRAGIRGYGLDGLDPCRVSAAGASHLIACAFVAAVLRRTYPDHRIVGEYELRRDERQMGLAIASAHMGIGPYGRPLLHRPDLVMWPPEPTAGSSTRPPESTAGLPVAVEVELTIKAPRRLTEICRAWARCRGIAGVLYVAPPSVARALSRAIARAQAHERIAVLGPEALLFDPSSAFGAEYERACPESTVPSDA